MLARNLVERRLACEYFGIRAVKGIVALGFSAARCEGFAFGCLSAFARTFRFGLRLLYPGFGLGQRHLVATTFLVGSSGFGLGLRHFMLGLAELLA